MTTGSLALFRPREVPDRNNEEAVAGICDTGKCSPPSEERGQKREEATGCKKILIRVSRTVTNQVSQAEEEEGKVDAEEEREKYHSGLHGAQKHKEGEDEPPLQVSRIS